MKKEKKKKRKEEKEKKKKEKKKRKERLCCRRWWKFQPLGHLASGTVPDDVNVSWWHSPITISPQKLLLKDSFYTTFYSIA